MDAPNGMRRISLEDIAFTESVIAVEMPYAEFVRRFGERHSGQPADWHAAGPVELWFFELPWGQRIILEYHLSIERFNIYLGLLEIEAVIDYLGVRDMTYYLDHSTIGPLKKKLPMFTDGLGTFHLYRQDDNGNKVLMHSYESKRVAEYYRKLYEDRGHKQLYWVEQEPA